MEIPEITVHDVRALLDAPSQEPVLYIDTEDGEPTLEVWAKALVPRHAIVFHQEEIKDFLRPDHPDGLTDDTIAEFLPNLQEDVDQVCSDMA